MITVPTKTEIEHTYDINSILDKYDHKLVEKLIFFKIGPFRWNRPVKFSNLISEKDRIPDPKS